MRYFRIAFLDKAATSAFMEVTDDGNFSRLSDMHGNTLSVLPHPSYRTLDTKEAEKPVWGE